MKKLLILMLSCITFAPQAARAMGLLEATKSGDVARVTELLNIPGTDVNQTGIDGIPPLHRAAINNNEAIVRLLLEHGAAVDQQTDLGLTPLDYAAMYGYKAIVRLLLENGADVNKTDNRGMTPLQAIFDREKMYGIRPFEFEAVVRLLQEWPAELARRAEAKQKAGLAISTGLHPRAGAASQVRHVSPADIQQVMSYLKPADYATPEPEVQSEAGE